jgi:hypothetical protein
MLSELIQSFASIFPVTRDGAVASRLFVVPFHDTENAQVQDLIQMTCVRGEDNEDHCVLVEDFAYMGSEMGLEPVEDKKRSNTWPITARAQIAYGIRTESTQ